MASKNILQFDFSGTADEIRTLARAPEEYIRPVGNPDRPLFFQPVHSVVSHIGLRAGIQLSLERSIRQQRSVKWQVLALTCPSVKRPPVHTKVVLDRAEMVDMHQ